MRDDGNTKQTASTRESERTARVTHEVEHAAESAGRELFKNSFGLLLLLVLATLTVLSLIPETAWGITLVTVMLASTLALALYTSSAPRRLQQAGLVIAVVTVVFSLPLTPQLTGFLSLFGIAWVVLVTLAALAVLRALVHLDRVNAQAILGVVCVYLLLGLSFVLAFAVIGRVQGGFFAEQADWTTSELVYFSYVTLTTLGYGDFTPATDVGRYAAVIEAVIGQVFLVVIVARFVSLWGRETPDVPTRSERREARRERARPAVERAADDSSDESAASSGDD